MPKMKTKRCAAKRYSVTGSGNVKRARAGKRHMMREKNKSRLRGLMKKTLVHSADSYRVSTLLPYGTP